MGAASRLAANSFTKTRQAGRSRELAGKDTGLRRNSRCEFGRVGRGQGAGAALRFRLVYRTGTEREGCLKRGKMQQDNACRINLGLQLG